MSLISFCFILSIVPVAAKHRKLPLDTLCSCFMLPFYALIDLLLRSLKIIAKKYF